jgi:hypothetical protein
MGTGQKHTAWLGLAVGLLGSVLEVAAANPEMDRPEFGAPVVKASRTASFRQIYIEQLPVKFRDSVRGVLEKPTLTVNGPVEVFRGQPEFYHRLLDHPDQGVLMWRKLGAKCMDITDLGHGRFAWTDGQGTEIQWETVFQNDDQRIWYAVGSSRAPFSFGKIPARAVVVLRHSVASDRSGKPVIQQQAELYLQFDSKAVTFLCRMLGISAVRAAEHGLSQMQLFYSALVWYSDRHPELAEAVVEKPSPVIFDPLPPNRVRR